MLKVSGRERLFLALESDANQIGIAGAVAVQQSDIGKARAAGRPVDVDLNQDIGSALRQLDIIIDVRAVRGRAAGRTEQRRQVDDVVLGGQIVEDSVEVRRAGLAELEGVGTGATAQRVVADAAGQGVVAAATPQVVITAAARQDVILAAAEDQVLDGAAGDSVGRAILAGNKVLKAGNREVDRAGAAAVVRIFRPDGIDRRAEIVAIDRTAIEGDAFDGAVARREVVVHGDLLAVILDHQVARGRAVIVVIGRKTGQRGAVGVDEDRIRDAAGIGDGVGAISHAEGVDVVAVAGAERVVALAADNQVVAAAAGKDIA